MRVGKCLAGLALCALLAAPARAGQDLVFDTDDVKLQQGGEGPFTAVLMEALAGSGLSVTYHARPWARCFEETRTGEADGLFAIYRTAEREKQLLFSNEPIYLDREHVFVRRGEPFDGARWRDLLRGKRIGIVNGSYHGRLYQEAVEQNLFASIEMVNSPESLASMLAAGRIDAAFSTIQQMNEAMSRMRSGPAIEAAQPAIDTLPVYLAFTRKRDMSAVRDLVDRGLRKLKEDGRYDALRERFASGDEH